MCEKEKNFCANYLTMFSNDLDGILYTVDDCKEENLTAEISSKISMLACI